jgi:ABC-type bacteriocin/lantibiotic exporter with double-glycine peptidase domain
MISKKKVSTRRIKFVKQKHKTGCGVACIAMILGCSYDQGMKIVHPRRKLWKKPYTSIKKIALVLNKKKLKFKINFVNGIDLKNIKRPCILGVRNGSKKSLLFFPKSWHWVIFDKRVLDPYLKSSYSIEYCQKNTFIIFEILNTIK